MATSDPKALLAHLLAHHVECEWLEFKHNNCDPDEIGRCISACANAAMLADRDRAFLVYGIENKTKQRLGTNVRLRELKKGAENLTNWLNRMVEPRLMMEFIDFEEKGKHYAILVIEPSYDRPVRFSGMEYVRIGENIKKLHEFPEHERALWLATGRRKFESAVALPHQTEEQVFEKLDVDTYYKLTNKPTPKNRTEIVRQFSQAQFIRTDGEGGYDITNLGALLFAKDISIFPSVAHKALRVIRYSGKNKKKSEGEIEGKRGYAVGFSGVLKYIFDRLPKEERFREGVRKLQLVYSQTAVREIIANALIHQDFTISGVAPVVEIYEAVIYLTQILRRRTMARSWRMVMDANLTNPIYNDEEAAREFLEHRRWPDGPYCPHCGATRVTALPAHQGKPSKAHPKGKTVCGLHQCNECHGQFTVTVGTLYERSHIPLHKWLLATHLLTASKKGISAHQLHRMLGITYKSAWFMAHRIREGLRETHPEPLGGANKVVEADETYIGGKAANRAYKEPPPKEAAIALVERDGRVRSFHIANVTSKTLRGVLVTQIDRKSFLMTDEAMTYVKTGREFSGHGTVNHSANEYVRHGGFMHTNTVENYFSVLKRGIYGVYHHVSPAHLKRYLAEFDFRYNERASLGVDDKTRGEKALDGIAGKRLTYRRIGERAN